MRTFTPKKRKNGSPLKNNKDNNNKSSPMKKQRTWGHSNRVTKKNLDQYTIMKNGDDKNNNYNLDEFKKQYLGEEG